MIVCRPYPSLALVMSCHYWQCRKLSRKWIENGYWLVNGFETITIWCLCSKDMKFLSSLQKQICRVLIILSIKCVKNMSVKWALTTQIFWTAWPQNPVTGEVRLRPWDMAYLKATYYGLTDIKMLDAPRPPTMADCAVPFWAWRDTQFSDFFPYPHRMRCIASSAVSNCGRLLPFDLQTMSPPLTSEKASYYMQRDPDPWQSWFAKWCNIQYISMGTRASHLEIVLT